MGNKVFKSDEYRQAVANLSAEELALVKKQFAHLASRSPDHRDTVDKDTFLRFIPLPGMLGERMFSVCDRDHDNAIDFEDFVTSVALLTHGSEEDRYRLIFQMYDVDGLGKISRSELEMMFNSIRLSNTVGTASAVASTGSASLAGGNSSSGSMLNSSDGWHTSPPPLDTPSEPTPDINQLDEQETHALAQKISDEIHDIDVRIEHAHGDSAVVPSLLEQKFHKERLLARMGRDVLDEYRRHGETLHNTVKKMAEDAFRSCNMAKDGTLTFEQFKHWAEQNPMIFDSVFESEGINELRHRLQTRPSMRNINKGLAPPRGVMYGYLLKAHRGRRVMDRRFFLLQDHFLYEFKNEKAAMSEDTAPRRATFLPGCHIFSELYPSRSGSPTESPTPDFERAMSPPPMSLGRSASRNSRSTSRNSNHNPGPTARERDRARSKSRERIGTRSPSVERELAHRAQSPEPLARPAPLLRASTSAAVLVHDAPTGALSPHGSTASAATLQTPPRSGTRSPEAAPNVRRVSSSSSIKDMVAKRDGSSPGGGSPTLRPHPSPHDSRDAKRLSIGEAAVGDGPDDTRNGSHSPSPSSSPVPGMLAPAPVAPVAPVPTRPKNPRSLTTPHAPVFLAPVDDWHVSQQQQQQHHQQHHHAPTSLSRQSSRHRESRAGSVAALFGLNVSSHHDHHGDEGRSLASTKSRGSLSSHESLASATGQLRTGDDDAHDGTHEMIDKSELHEIEIVGPNLELLLYAEDQVSVERWIKALEEAAQDRHVEDYYEIEYDRQLGTGFFADVYLARARVQQGHIEAGEEVACKIVYKEAMSEAQTEMFRAEIACLNLVRHPNIVAVYNVFDTPEKMYIVMELLQGGSVLTRLERDGYFRYDEGRDIVKQLCEGIRYLHDVGIVHRDIKPGNLVFASEREGAVIKIVDFGLSTFASTSDPLEKPVGTLKYFAPELILHKPYNREVDMWCVGIVTYIITVAQFPFEARNQQDLVDNIVAARYNTTSENWRAVPEPAKDFIRRLLVVDPERRLTADEAVKHPWLQDGPDDGRPPMLHRRSSAQTPIASTTPLRTPSPAPVETAPLAKESPPTVHARKDSKDAVKRAKPGLMTRRTSQDAVAGVQ